MKTVFPPLLVSVFAVCAAAAAPARAPDAPHRSFPEGTVIDVTKPPYNVTPDDGEDDTAAVQRAISDHVSTGAFLYFPEGTYDFSAPLINSDSVEAYLDCDAVVVRDPVTGKYGLFVHGEQVFHPAEITFQVPVLLTFPLVRTSFA